MKFKDIPFYLLIGSITMLLVSVAIGIATPSPKPATIAQITPTPIIEGLDANILWSEINLWRVSAGLRPYHWNDGLCKYAAIRTEEIKTDWSHDKFWNYKQLAWEDLHYIVLGENLARDFTDEVTALHAWLNSPTHRNNLEYSYTDSCVVTSGGYAVQMFAQL